MAVIKLSFSTSLMCAVARGWVWAIFLTTYPTPAAALLPRQVYPLGDNLRRPRLPWCRVPHSKSTSPDSIAFERAFHYTRSVPDIDKRSMDTGHQDRKLITASPQLGVRIYLLRVAVARPPDAECSSYCEAPSYIQPSEAPPSGSNWSARREQQASITRDDDRVPQTL